ncbi:hypothetical protein V4891_22665, partial [Ralstonia solanacearum species complex bacterium KE055]
QAAGAVVARAIGDIADAKRAEALAAADQAHKDGNDDLAKQYAADADRWKEGGAYRAGLHMAGGALVAGLGGGSAIGGAVGAGAASLAAPRLTELADKVSSSVGGGAAGQVVGNVVANVAAGAVGSVGGGSGAFMGANVDRYNRQLHPDEKEAIHKAAHGDASEEDKLTKAACYRVQCWAQYSPNSPEYLANLVEPEDAKGLVKELAWVDSHTVRNGLFDYTLGQKATDFGLNQLDQFKRGVQEVFGHELPNLPRGFVNKMEADAKQKMSESPAALVAQGVANGLNAVVGAGGVEPPPASPGAVLVNSGGARQAANASLGATANPPPNAIASSNNGDSSGENQATGGKSSSEQISPNKGVDLTLHYKEGWNDAQRAAADAKVDALNSANLVVTPVERSGTSASRRYKAAGGEVPKNSDVDHTIDLQLGGADTRANMAPLDSSVNRSLGAQIQQRTKDLSPGTSINSVKIKDR